MSLDLFNFTSDKANVPFDLVIKHPISGDPTDIVIQVLGTDSTAAQTVLENQQAKRFREMTKGDGEIGLPDFDPKQSRDNFLEVLVACTAGWKNVQWQGKDLEFNALNAAMIYEKTPFLRDQVNRATGSRKLFFKD